MPAVKRGLLLLVAPAALTPRLSLSAVASRAGPRRNRARAPPERIACPLVRAPLRRQLGRVGALPGDHRRSGAAAGDRRGRLRQLRHALRARLGRAALARRNAGVRSRDRPHAPSAARGARPGALAARSPHGRAGHGRPRLPRAGGVRLGGLRARQAVVRPRRRSVGGADPAHARADPLLRRSRIRRHPLPAARPERPARRVTRRSRANAEGARRSGSRPARRCWRCSPSPAFCDRRLGRCPGSTGCI